MYSTFTASDPGACTPVGSNNFRKFLFSLIIAGLHVQRTISLQTTFRSIARSSRALLLLSHRASSLLQAPTRKLSPSAVTSRVPMATLTPPRSGADPTCLTPSDSKYSLPFIFNSINHTICIFIYIWMTGKLWLDSDRCKQLGWCCPIIFTQICICQSLWCCCGRRFHCACKGCLTKPLLDNALHPRLELPHDSVTILPLPELFWLQTLCLLILLVSSDQKQTGREWPGEVKCSPWF